MNTTEYVNTSGVNHFNADIRWDTISPDAFWSAADRVQEETLAQANAMFSTLRTADPETLRELLIQYRYFTVYYITDLALLIAGMEDGPMRSFLADILYDELGCGKSNGAHPALYDKFLSSIGVDDRDLNSEALATNVALLDEARRRLVDPVNGSNYGIGLRGMGGECVCQVYIAQLHAHLIDNPFIREHKDKIDWRFWDLHVGEHDIEHREKTRALINTEVVARGGTGLEKLGLGYEYSMESWRQFWINIFAIAEPAISRTADRKPVRGAVGLQIN
ncbi:iron-containing redox enzyme family protein [uncultured Bradyrhizobium sp.]|uniref:iron-containing redox enzyme family protein n=1 Tax=uncultured Bradyrhizobium sp. TaxID=199684 RepID=UPI0035CA6A1F